MTDLLTIRRAGPADLGAVGSLVRRAFPRFLKEAYPPSTMVMAVPLLLDVDLGQLSRGRHWVALDDNDRIVGAGGWSIPRRRWSDPRQGAIRQFATDPGFARRGVGAALMQKVVADARAEGITVLNCHATLNAVPFYEAMGFGALGPIRFDLGPAITFTAMSMLRRL